MSGVGDRGTCVFRKTVDPDDFERDVVECGKAPGHRLWHGRWEIV